jgi:hypothetical protein
MCSVIKGFETPLASPESKPHLLHRFLKSFGSLLEEAKKIPPDGGTFLLI